MLAPPQESSLPQAPSPAPASLVSLYAQLHVTPTAPMAVIEAAYRANCAAAPAEIPALTAAYRVLRDPRQRAVYDLELRQTCSDDPEAPEPRVRTCWRCAEPLPAAAPYCSTCHWTRCERCHGCGCENPAWLRARPVRLVRWPMGVVLLIGALGLAIGTGSTLRPVAETLPGALAALACAAGPPPPTAPRPAPVASSAHVERQELRGQAPAEPIMLSGPPAPGGLVGVFTKLAQALAPHQATPSSSDAAP